MSEELIVVEINCTTGEQTTRPMTDQEIQESAERSTREQASRAAAAAAEQAKSEARESAIAKLRALDLTDTEISAILG
jgi:hypothetical protein